ncbi:hypothetical protein SPI_01959 [Niveomyces insectorum RCEF 264]|uniref:Uncharacterized protein n=1 Tax=Niveomyces insectorum RCEF 264 TaxID=1081102 RepID=A0A162J864_9HYPO|nr:hypothetical protein SPI_01959 [Niveomyces insectorum RCEF 264]
MASKQSTVPMAQAGLTERELLLVTAAYLCPRDGGDPTVDWTKFAALAGYASSNSARVCFRPLQKKLKAFVDNMLGDVDGGTATGSGVAARETPRTPKTPQTPKTTKPPPETPGSKSRGQTKKRKQEDDDYDDNLQGGVGVPVKEEEKEEEETMTIHYR